MVRHEYNFTRNIPIKSLFHLILSIGSNKSGWKFQHNESTYSFEWKPTLMKNSWRKHPKVSANLESLSENETICRITTKNMGFIDPFKSFKKQHDKVFNDIFLEVQKKSFEIEVSKNETQSIENYVKNITINLLGMERNKRNAFIHTSIIPQANNEKSKLISLLAFVKLMEMKCLKSGDEYQAQKYSELWGDLGSLAGVVFDIEQSMLVLAGDFSFLAKNLTGWKV